MYAALMEVIEHADEVAQAAGQPVEFPNNQRIATCNVLRQRSKAGRLVSAPLVLKDFLASGFLQGGELQSRVLVLGRDAGATVFHFSDFRHGIFPNSAELFPAGVAAGRSSSKSQIAGIAATVDRGRTDDDLYPLFTLSSRLFYIPPLYLCRRRVLAGRMDDTSKA
jgi:hypothetical protein